MKSNKPASILFILTTSIFLSVGQKNYAQTIVFEEQVDTTPDITTYGPNKRNFTHFFAGFGFFAGPSDAEGSDIKYGVSNDLELGFRYKRKISNFYAIGSEIAYHGSSFVLKQDSLKTLPNPTLNKNEVFRFYGFSLSLYNRFNFGRRGNVIGNYIDVGGNFELPYSVVHNTKNVGANGAVVRVLTTHLDYINRYNYYGFFRVGSNKFAIKASYRFSDLFKTKSPISYYNYAELPRILLALQLGIHK